jgi:DNA repair protein RadC
MKAFRGKGVRIVYDVVRERDDAPPFRVMRKGADAARYVVDLQGLGLVPSEREAFMVLALDARHGVIGFQVVSIGTLNSASVHPREVFRFAIGAGAAAVILAHNHPSGDHTPSHQDRAITERLTKAGELLGINVLDHLVVGGASYFSFSDGSSFPIEEPD